MVRLEILGELLVLLVRTIVRVFIHMCMIAGYLFDYLLVLLDVLGIMLIGTGVGVVD